MTSDDRTLRGPSTRERLLAEGLRLFAEQGFRATTTAQIEEAAGLVPRRGGLHKHFVSKEALLVEGLEQRIAALDVLGSVGRLLPLDDRHAELTLLARLILEGLDQTRDVLLVIEKEANRFPDLRREFFERIIKVSYRQTSELLRTVANDDTQRDWKALGVVALGSLIEYRRSTWLYGGPPGGVPEDEFVRTWVRTWEAALATSI